MPLHRLFDRYLWGTARADSYVTPHRYRLPLPVPVEPPAGLPEISSYRDATDWLAAELDNLISLFQIGGSTFAEHRDRAALRRDR